MPLTRLSAFCRCAGRMAGVAVGLVLLTSFRWPDRGPARDPFSIYARTVAGFTVNQVSYGINAAKGAIGVDSMNRGTFGGGVWPRGTTNGYMFASGFQVVGITAGAKSSTNPWGGDTAGAKFYDGRGIEEHGEEVSPFYRSYEVADAAVWPEYARVPESDPAASLFDPLLRGRMAASQGDGHFITWEGDPQHLEQRAHPMGIVLEHRLLAWNYPTGNEDLFYVIVTAYNVTSLNAADYAEIRPSMRSLLMQKANEFHQLNNAAFHITLSPSGMTYDPFYMMWGGDVEIGVLAGGSSENAKVSLPFALGVVWRGDFIPQGGYQLPPEINSPPFMAAQGLLGIKYLKSPTGPAAIHRFSVQTGGGSASGGNGDPVTAAQILGLAGGSPAGCNHLNPAVNHVCNIPGGGNGTDKRMTQSAPPTVLAPGKSATIAIAYIHAAPVKLTGYTPSSSQQITIGTGQTFWIGNADSLRLKSPVGGRGGTHRVDSISGFLGYTGPYFDDVGNTVAHTPKMGEYDLVPRSLLAKARMAQAIFDNKFLMPSAPVAPEFFIIPGDHKATVLWRPSTTEMTGDPYFPIANVPNLPDGGRNELYDPNFRRYDVEGYRIYRGRSDDPSSMALLAQFDYAGTIISDYGGHIFRQLGTCAPELGLNTCGVTFPGPITPGVSATTKADFALNSSSGTLIQVLAGNRLVLPAGQLFHLKTDTLLRGGAPGTAPLPPLADTGVPFVFVDEATNACLTCGLINGLEYTYTVTAFDVNSLRSGPSSFESERVVKRITVGSVAANFDNTVTTAIVDVKGRSQRTARDLPTIDPSNGRFSGPFPPTNSATLRLNAFIPELLKGAGTVGIRLDSINGRPVLNNGATTAVTPYYFTVVPATGPTFQVSANITLNAIPATSTTSANATARLTTDSVVFAPFTAMTFDAALAAVYGATSEGYAVTATWTMKRQKSVYVSSWGRGCAAQRAPSNTFAQIPGFGFDVTPKCYYNGPRWFSGDNESMNHPTAQTPWVENPALVPVANRRYSNAGQLTGVSTVHFPASYGMIQGAGWAPVELALAHYVTAADYRLYWGTAGQIDSVIDITHDIPIPFRPEMNNSWGVLNANGVPQSMRYSRRDLLTVTDITCTWPLKSYRATNQQSRNGYPFDSIGTGGVVLGAPCQTPLSDSLTRASAINLVSTVVPGPIAFFNDTLSRVKRAEAAPRAASDGFLLYLKGRVYLFELAGSQLPAAGTRWTLRDYVGAISGGTGDAGDLGAYSFYPIGLPFTAVGATMQFRFDVRNQVAAPGPAALARIHTVPDPYYVNSSYETLPGERVLKFLNVPSGAKIRIHTSSGILVTELANQGSAHEGTVLWDVKNRSNKVVASGVYFWVVTADGVTQTGRMTIVTHR